MFQPSILRCKLLVSGKVTTSPPDKLRAFAGMAGLRNIAVDMMETWIGDWRGDLWGGGDTTDP